ncbi:DUF1830 domain-containing protein [Chlorogloeopsis sp. ULAP01]|uniref:DUF1830 domain-containing protein n=1 Tax=Chlorogloeopsis sp. ULAP01 TaxID=3056483 RepID=UPI0025AB51C8|nr:DUF1830 domain-containing protein [Chlorogloeopsis sp. ULAP01]MDM9385673.1 DUF1830 domain-containing protein [Chlorogloeopsis sp. ULAP01]
MTHLLNPPLSNDSHYILCYFVNNTSQVQIARISNIPGWFFERVVFPGQRLMFKAPPNACLEIYTGEMVSSLLCDRIDCRQLQVLSLTSVGGCC